MCDALRRHNASGPEQLCASKNDYRDGDVAKINRIYMIFGRFNE